MQYTSARTKKSRNLSTSSLPNRDEVIQSGKVSIKNWKPQKQFDK